MKKTLIAAAVMAASGVAFAASNVTLYGVIDTGLLVSKVKHKDTLVQMSTGFDSGSRWGIKGVEDLGNGYAVGFQLEQGFDSDTGADNATSSAGKSFGRESRLYVTVAFGELGFGRFGSLASGAGSYNILTGWVFGTSYDVSGSWTSFGRANSRVNNAIAYVSPSFAGFNLYAMYSNGTSDDANKWAKNDHYYGLGLKYANGPAKASLIFEAADNKSNYDIAATAEPWDVGSKLVEKFTGIKGAFDKDDADEVGVAKFKAKTSYAITAGGAYNFGVVEAQGIYQYAWQSDFYKQHAFGLGIKAPVAGGTFGLGARMLLGKFDGTAKTILCKEDTDKYRAWNIGANYKYPLSKRTAVYGYAGYSDGAKWLKDVDSGKYNGWAVGTGLVHSF